MLIKNDKDFAEYLGTHPDNLRRFQIEYADYTTMVESDGFSVIVRLCEDTLPSNSWVIAYPFEDYQFDDVLTSAQCFADHLAHEGKGKHGNYDGICINDDVPPLLEDEIAEVLERFAGKEICIMKCPSVAERFVFNTYEENKDIVFKIYDALRHHYFVTVDNRNIIDL